MLPAACVYLTWFVTASRESATQPKHLLTWAHRIVPHLQLYNVQWCRPRRKLRGSEKWLRMIQESCGQAENCRILYNWVSVPLYHRAGVHPSPEIRNKKSVSIFIQFNFATKGKSVLPLLNYQGPWLHLHRQFRHSISVSRTCRKLAAKGFKIENAGSINNLASAYVSSTKWTEITESYILHKAQDTCVVYALHLHKIIRKAFLLSCFDLDLSATQHNLIAFIHISWYYKCNG